MLYRYISLSGYLVPVLGIRSVKVELTGELRRGSQPSLHPLTVLLHIRRASVASLVHLQHRAAV